MTQSNRKRIPFNDPFLGQISRRSLLKRAAVLSLSLPAISGLLAACGEDDEDVAADPEVGEDTDDDVAADPDADEDTDDDGPAPEAEDDDPAEAEDDTASDVEAGTPQSGGVLYVGGSQDPDVLDPHVTSWGNTASMMNSVLDTLVRADRDDEDEPFKPGLAETWEINDDATNYTFYLRDGVQFTDGTPLDADAVRFTFDRIADPETGSALAANLLSVNYVETDVIDDSTVTVVFSEPYAAFMDSVGRANLGIVSPSAVEEMGEEFVYAPVGSGYFQFDEWVANQHIQLVRNEDYEWGSPGLFENEGPAYLDAIVFQTIPEESARLAAFENEEIQMTGIPARLMNEYEEREGIAVSLHTYHGFPNGYLINTENPPTDDIRVRQAIIHAVDGEVVNQVSYNGVFKGATTPLNSPSFGYDPEAELYPYDPDRARELLEEAGWEEGPDGIRVKDGERLHVIFTGSADWGDMSEPIQPLLQDVGIEMEIRILTAAARSDTNMAGGHHLAGLGLQNSDPSVLTNMFHSQNIETGFSWSRFRSDELDDLLVRAQGEPDPERRRELLSELQFMIMENALYVPVIERGLIYAWHDYVHGIKQDTRGFPYFYDTWMER